MDILWGAMGICAIVCLLFYALATRWQRILRQQSWMMRKLAERVKTLEEVSDPQFRQRLSESAPMPLEQVFTFSFRLSEQFWRGTLGSSDKDWEFVRRFGSVVGAIKIEVWRSHSVVTITEALPTSSTAQWQERLLDLYPDDSREALCLWELPLRLPNGSNEHPPSLGLLLRGKVIELRGHLQGDESGPGVNGGGPVGDVTFFRVPLDTAQLAEFRSHEPDENSGSSSNSESGQPASTAWRAFYSFSDDRAGFDWQLWVRDLTRKAEWDRWKILEPTAVRAAHE